MLPLEKGRALCPNLSISYYTALNDLRAIRVDGSGYGEHSGQCGGTTAAAITGVSHKALNTQGHRKSGTSVQHYTDNATSARTESVAALTTYFLTEFYFKNVSWHFCLALTMANLYIFYIHDQ